MAFMQMGFGADQAIDEATPVDADILVDDAGWSVDLGGVHVEAQYHGFGQTEGDLFVYVPEAKALWTGNPLVAEQPAIPWLLDGHAEAVETTLAAVQATLPADAIVIPGHSRPQTRASFDFAIAYLDTLVAEIHAAVDADLSLEQTQANVTMPEFAGYALWDWVHTAINIPATYTELAQP
jgi:glyoxylase-like metal-dependent hydrolase (beta-lactamase superfamily II)